jgi:hypothetical protein
MRVRLTVIPRLGYSMCFDQVGGQGSRCKSGADPPL